MGRKVDLDKPLSAEDRAYLIERGRGYLIPANERRFGADGQRTPEPHEAQGATTQSPFYDNQERERAVYDQGGAPLPGVVLDYNTGRVADRDNGQTVEFSGPGHTPGVHDLSSVRSEYGGFSSYEVDDQGNPVDDEIDPRIVHEVVSAKNITELRKRLKSEGVEFAGDDKREELENKLAIHLDDKLRAGEYEPPQIPTEEESEENAEGEEQTAE